MNQQIDEIDLLDDREHYRVMNPKTRAKMAQNEDHSAFVMKIIFDEPEADF